MPNKIIFQAGQDGGLFIVIFLLGNKKTLLANPPFPLGNKNQPFAYPTFPLGNKNQPFAEENIPLGNKKTAFADAILYWAKENIWWAEVEI